MSEAKDNLLPIASTAFVSECRQLFVLSDDIIKALFSELTKHHTRFSVSTIKKLTQTDANGTVAIRRVLVYLIINLSKDGKKLSNSDFDEKAKKIGSELESIGIEKSKIELLMEQVRNLDESVLSACKTIYDIEGYLYAIQHVARYRTEINYTSLYDTGEEPDKPFTLFPLIHVELVSHDGSENESVVNFNIDPNGLEQIIEYFRSTLDSLKREYGTLKNGLNNNIVTTDTSD